MSERATPRKVAAERNNDQLFPLFRNNLKSDHISEFSNSAAKLAAWLKVDKAYYPKARPIIIELLETALATVSRHSSFPSHSEADRPWVEPFVRLVRTVTPFYLSFPEQDLQLRLRALIQTIGENVDEILSQQSLVQPRFATKSASPSTATSPPLTPISPLALQSPPVIHPVQSSSVTLTPAPYGQLPNSGITGIPASSRPNVEPDPGKPAPSASTMTSLVGRPKTKKRKISLDEDFIKADLNWYQSKQSSEQVVPSTTEQQHEILPPPVPASEETLLTSTTDVQKPQLSEITSTGSISQDDVTAEATTTVVDTTSIAPNAKPTKHPSPDRTSRSPSMRLRDLLSVRSRSPSIPLRDEVTSTPLKRKASGAAGGDPDSPTSMSRRQSPPSDVKQMRSSPPKLLPLSDATGLPSPLPLKKVKKRRKGPPGLRILPIRREDSTNVPAAITLNELEHGAPTASTSQSTTPGPQLSSSRETSTSAQVPLEMEPSAPVPVAILEETTNVGSPETIIIDEIELPSATTAIEREREDVDVIGHALADKEEEALVEDVIMRDPSPPLIEPEQAPFEQAIQSPAETDTVLDAEPQKDAPILEVARTDDPHKTTGEETSSEPSQLVPISTPVSISDAPRTPMPSLHAENETVSESSPFQGKSIRLLKITRGHSGVTPVENPVILDFELSPAEITQIARWNDRRFFRSDDCVTSMCVSLVSYPLSQCVDAMANRQPEQMDIAQCGHPSPWPKDGSLYVVLEYDGPQSFCISPPFGIHPNRAVDLGTRGLHSGTNTFRMYQYRDHSDHTFAVVLHHPTEAQLAELRSARTKEQQLQECLEKLGRFDLPMPRLTDMVLPPTVNGVGGH